MGPRRQTGGSAEAAGAIAARARQAQPGGSVRGCNLREGQKGGFAIGPSLPTLITGTYDSPVQDNSVVVGHRGAITTVEEFYLRKSGLSIPDRDFGHPLAKGKIEICLA